MNEQVRLRPASDSSAYEAFTARDFLEMVKLGGFQDMRAELVRGELQKMSPAHGDHGRQNFSIGLALARVLGDDAPIAIDLVVMIDETTVRAVDIALGREKIPSGAARGDDLLLVVEIADSTLARDLSDKADDCARAGIPTYWVVDLNGHAVHVMTGPGDKGYANREIVRFGEDLAVPGSDETIIIS